MGFVDSAEVDISSGHGGKGVISFRSSRSLPRGGPDGGDGGRGGDICFFVHESLQTLAQLRFRRVFRAENGQPGGPNRRHGRDGRNVMIGVPPGSAILDVATGAVLRDLTSPDDSWVAVRGGVGGRGNARFTNSRDQAPRIAESGASGRTATVRVELKSLTDIGLIGMPNSGKSTLLSALTNARPAAAPYPFTTRTVTLGTMEFSDRQFVIAELPGILRGSANGKGLGLSFLKHVARSHLLIFLIDLSEANGGDSYLSLNRELQAFDPGLSRKHHLIVASKADLDDDGARLAALDDALENVEICAVSAVSGEGIHSLKEVLAFRVPE